MIYILEGKNGSGKTFLSNALHKLGYNRSVSYTTRKPRENEKEGCDYIFTSKEDFEAKIKLDFFLEYQQANGNYYGTPKQNLQNGTILVASDENDIERICEGKVGIFYIDSPLELRYERMLTRGCSSREIFDRFNKENYSYLHDFKGCFIDNADESHSLEQIIEYMNNPEYMTNNFFIRQQIKKYQPINTNDELLVFLQFEEFLMRVIYLDKKICTSDIDKIYSKYMKKFLAHKDIDFHQEGNQYSIILNGCKYCYTLDKSKIKGKGEKEDEKEID